MDIEYLNKTVGAVLTDAIAEAVVKRPADPCEFIANYLLMHAKAEERAKERERESKELQAQREQHKQHEEEETKRKLELARQRAEEEKRQEKARIEEDERLLKLFMEEEKKKQDEIAAKSLVEKQRIEQANADRDDEETETMDPLFENILRYQTAKEHLLSLDKSKLLELRSYKVGNHTLVKVLRAFFYILDYKLGDVKTWGNIRSLLQGHVSDIMKKCSVYDPLTIQKKLKFINVNRALKGLTEEKVKGTSFVAFVMYLWITRIVELRQQAVAERKKAQEAGVDVDELEEDQVDEEGNVIATLSADEEDSGDIDDAVVFKSTNSGDLSHRSN